MSNTRNTGFLTNVVKYTDKGDISFVSGSTTLMSISSSGAVTVTGVISGSNALTSSYSQNSELLDNLDSTSFVFTSSFNTYSSSMSTRVTNTESTGSTLTSASASLNTASGSFSTRVTRIEGNYATTGSNVFLGAQTVCANITSTGTIIAQTLNVQQVTSSVVYSSGSNTFGCALTDVQQFTGSVRITGSLNVAGNTCVGGTITGTTVYGSTAICGGAVSGTTGTFSGQLCTPSSLVLGTNNAYALYLRDSTGAAKPVMATAGATNLNIYNICSTGTININNATDTGVILSLTNAGAATFSSTLNAGGAIKTSGQNLVNEASVLKFSQESSTVSQIAAYGATTGTAGTLNIIMKSSDASVNNVALSFASTGAATFSSSVQATAIAIGVTPTANILVVKGENNNYDGTIRIGERGYLQHRDAGQTITSLANDYNSDSAKLEFRMKGNTTSDAKMTILGSGNVGIGTTNPQSLLSLGSGVNAQKLLMYDANDNYKYGFGIQVNELRQFFPSDAYMTFGTISIANGSTYTERMRITSDGAVGIGCATPSYRLDILDTCATGVRGLRINTASSSVGPSIILRYCPGGLTNWLIGTSQAVSHALEFISSNSLGGDPGSAGTTKLLITCGGKVGIMTTDPKADLHVCGGGATLRVGPWFSTNDRDFIELQASGTDTRILSPNERFKIENTDGCVQIVSGGSGGVQLTPGATSWASMSDIRKKKNFESTQGLAALLQIEPVKYHFQWDNDCMPKRMGFIAQNIQPLIPEMVSKTDEKAEDGSDYLTITPDYILPVLVKSIQEQQCTICIQSTIIDQLRICLGLT